MENFNLIYPESITNGNLPIIFFFIFSKDEAARDLVIVFTQTCRGCQVISMTLNALGFKAAALHSMISQKERTSGLAKFRSGH